MEEVLKKRYYIVKKQIQTTGLIDSSDLYCGRCGQMFLQLLL